ncbi:NAD(P)-dependent dehydrogenase (short-subunit alcohol dehydrogenase family) [Paenibacillus castaneae]|nr:hypothetical protein [Paenibacillus castaneae]NIK79008.1 NAD(P)-dependent dehydrogenase (short-subunit alcohol dehydrogenase family) [Paenibacillus castaneae]
MGISKEKAAIVMGAGSGMGREEVILLAKKGAKVRLAFRYND